MVLPYFAYPVISFVLAQGTKILLKTKRRKKLQWRDLFAYSDMPSGHTATVVSLATIIALELGLYSAEFALALVFMTIVITDAIGLRNYLGQHGKTLNVLVKGDQGVPYGKVVTAMSLLKQAGAEQVGLLTDTSVESQA